MNFLKKLKKKRKSDTESKTVQNASNDQIKTKTGKETIFYNQAEYLVYGYINDAAKEYDLFMRFEPGITQIIYKFYPRLLRFNYYNKERFNVTEDGTIIRGSQIAPCDAWTVFLESPDNKGFNTGIHYVSIKNINETATQCFRNIGIITERNEDIINNHSWTRWTDLKGDEQPVESFFEGRYKWKYNEVLSMKLDCNKWTMTYWKDDTLLKKDDISPNKSYHFAVNLCECVNWTHYQVVDHMDYCTMTE